MANIPSINPYYPSKILPAPTPEKNNAGGAPFSEMFNKALSNVASSDYEDKTTNLGLLTGELDNIHTATIAAEKAEIMLNLTVQVRNKIVEGYQEIMRMQM
ncbi:MAG: flagellar hook-basal body complex protein FliE [Oscillospiraceae bacterium]|nr:flagellar hook-basal body complex protein FliE [Oscillospiraceae bacterium]